MATLTMKPLLPLVQLILGTPRLWIPQRTEDGRDSRTTRLILNCRYPHQATCPRHIQCIPQRRAFYSANPLPAPLTQQSTAPLEGLCIQLQPRIHSVNSL